MKGDDYEPCTYFKKVFRDICPIEWVDKWNDQGPILQNPISAEKVADKVFILVHM
jgi:hypothetical protein